MKLIGYWRSSAAYRVRIALNLKGLTYQQESVHLVKDGGEQHQQAFRQLNPAGLVPVLVDGELTINQSMAMLDYLEQEYPQTPLMPKNTVARAEVQALAFDLACDIHPLNNLRVLQYLSNELDVSDEQKSAWYHHWIVQGFSALEHRLQQTAGEFCYGDAVTWADVCLVPQVYNAHRFNVPMEAFPTIQRIVDNCNALDAFKTAAPENQPDAT